MTITISNQYTNYQTTFRSKMGSQRNTHRVTLYIQDQLVLDDFFTVDADGQTSVVLIKIVPAA